MKISLIRQYTLIYARGTLGIGCMYTSQAWSHTVLRWHALANGEAEFFLSLLKNFVRIRTYDLYDKHILGTR